MDILLYDHKNKTQDFQQQCKISIAIWLRMLEAPERPHKETESIRKPMLTVHIQDQMAKRNI